MERRNASEPGTPITLSQKMKDMQLAGFNTLRGRSISLRGGRSFPYRYKEGPRIWGKRLTNEYYNNVDTSANRVSKA